MADTYLRLAEHVLQLRMRPLSAQEIIENAVRYELIAPDRGATMHKTLQARIAEDILGRQMRSRFFRAGRGTYFLRSLAEGPLTPPAHAGVDGKRRRPLPKQRILTISSSQIPADLQPIPLRSIDSLSTTYGYIEVSSALPICVFLVLTLSGRVFTHTVGKHSHFTNIVGRRTIGLRSFVDEFDRDLFSEDLFGLPESAARELRRNFSIADAAMANLLNTGRSRIRFFDAVPDHDHSRVLIPTLIDAAELLEGNQRPIRRLDVTSPEWLPFDPEPPINLAELDRWILGKFIH